MTVVDFPCAIAECCDYQSDCCSRVTIFNQLTRVPHHSVRPRVCRFYKVNMPSHTKTRTRRDRGGDEIAEVTHITYTRNYVIIIESVDSISRDGPDTPIYIIHYKK